MDLSGSPVVREMTLLYTDLDSAVEVISSLMHRVDDVERALSQMRGEVRDATLGLILSPNSEERRIGWQLAVQFGMAKEVDPVG